MTKEIIRTNYEYSNKFLVNEITSSPLECCNCDETLHEVFSRFQDYDFIPVKRDKKIIGVLQRGVENEKHLHSKTGDYYRPLDDGILIESKESISNLIHTFSAESPFRLVILGTEINGIITRSDFLKLPVRIYAFSLIADLEIRMKNIIQQEWPDQNSNGWFFLLSPGRQGKINEFKDEFKSGRSDPDLIELTSLIDKSEILRKKYLFNNKFRKDMVKINSLRNELAHARNYAPDDEGLTFFINTLKCIIERTNKLSEGLILK